MNFSSLYLLLFTLISPVIGLIKSSIVFIKVDLPAPFGPIQDSKSTFYKEFKSSNAGFIVGNR